MLTALPLNVLFYLK